MLKIESEKIVVNVKFDECIKYLSNLNNYKDLLPKEKINYWSSDENFCVFKIKNSYTLEIIKEKIIDNGIRLKNGKRSPFSFNILIEINDQIGSKCIAQIKCEADINPILKKLVGNPINELFNFMANKIEEAISTD